MEKIDEFLNNTTMYRLVAYVLAILSGLGIVFALFGRMPASPTSMVVSLAILLVSAYVADRGFGRLLNTPTNTESWLITALILFLIVRPADSVMGGIVLAMAGALSSASKFLLARNGKHIFNPAALAAALLSLTGIATVSWWVGSSMLWPFALVLGLAVVRKIRRMPLFLTFVVVSIVIQIVLLMHGHQPVFTDLKQSLIASPLIFLSTIMLTEPSTMPPRRNLQAVFAALVAVLYMFAWQIGPLTIYPEVALLLGNIFAYLVSPKFRLLLRLEEIQKVSDSVYNYVFRPNQAFAYLPGQYMELTLAGVPYDSRGNRRTFTLASSPTEDEVHIGLKYYDPSSTYKSAFSSLRPGDVVYASQLAGNFTIKGMEDRKLAFIAGGIGVTPFRSMVKYLTDEGIDADVVLLYAVPDAHEFAYVKEFKEAEKHGVRIVPIITRAGGPDRPGTIRAKISPELIAKYVPDYNERTFFISGPNAMVDRTKLQLQSLGVGPGAIVTDHFSGY